MSNWEVDRTLLRLGFALIVLAMLTGNCGRCGFDKDYIGQTVDAMGECE